MCSLKFKLLLTEATLLKSHFGMGALLQICCIFSEYLFLRTPVNYIISKLDSNKAYGDDMISIRMLELFDKSICKPLNIIFKSCLTQGIFPSE